MSNMGTFIGAILTAGALAGGGWGAKAYLDETYAPVELVQVAAGKVDFVLDRQLEALVAQISFLEQKSNKSATELHQLDYLRNQLDLMRKVRSGK